MNTNIFVIINCMKKKLSSYLLFLEGLKIGLTFQEDSGVAKSIGVEMSKLVQNF